jgi:hypothetical protein
LHPGVFAYLKWSPLVSPFILDGVAQGIMAEGVMINKDAKDFMQPAFGMYEKQSPFYKTLLKWTCAE